MLCGWSVSDRLITLSPTSWCHNLDPKDSDRVKLRKNINQRDDLNKDKKSLVFLLKGHPHGREKDSYRGMTADEASKGRHSGTMAHL